ncbi:hypothetical protein DTO013E5_81 [Penicillium roqueforti]|nr:uncharacterized protein LCP9604111_1055 [Penicillium roqueforti]KAF9253529.1 hypothetical protein LCP9604111_1055 [Penicillium roqueforti]KAI1839045.1 hypothetical protein CBS147337_770 [Penicillium roqueforti]KAI2686434.1 hypothetical protein CBS147355_1921 [Penicillium roqueforti]KAI2691517.1 hypothetical protein LCP963914a_1718 [Penicillium roqueforti]KAI2706461.1 hypothetical protein CBS147372_372 [Penicillium roqueforti]
MTGPHTWQTVPSLGLNMRFHISQDRYQLFMTVAKYDENHLKHPSDKEHNMQPIITVSSGLQPTSMTFEHMIAVDEQPKNVLVRF